MEPIVVPCGCGARIKVPATVAGKRIRCPKCEAAIDVPADASAAPPAAAPAAAKPKSAALKTFGTAPASATPAPKPAAATKECHYCGESILATAKKCKHCGEFLESDEPSAVVGAAPVPARRAAKSTTAKKAEPQDDPNPAEYFAAILLAPIGLIIGTFWAIQKQPKAKKMIQVAAAMSVIDCAAAWLLWAYVIREPEAVGAVVSREMIDRSRDGAQVYILPPGSTMPGEEEAPEQPQPNSNQRRELPGTGAGALDLEGQPPTIQRAMRANVLLQLDEGMGSGVIIQRKGDQIWILTNHHVIDLTFARTHGLQTTLIPAMKKVKVTYFDSQSSEGTVTWTAPDKIDLAIVKTKAPLEIEPVAWQGLPKVIVGQNVFAVGNPLGLSWTYTKGVVSRIGKDPYPPPPENKSREIGIIQHDTSLTYGNSGGGLYSEDGQLIGINSSIVNPALGKGLGFAIRLSAVMDLGPPEITLISPPRSKPAK